MGSSLVASISLDEDDQSDCGGGQEDVTTASASTPASEKEQTVPQGREMGIGGNGRALG